MRSQILTVFLLSTFFAYSQPSPAPRNIPERPKLVVGIVVDQMRWDYLYRYYDRYAPGGGFRRLLNKGFSCDNAFIDYVPTYTACGHTTLYTGSVPAVHGITGNEWWDVQYKRQVYCVQDDAAQGVGTSGTAGKMSPRNLQVTTICDELKLATNFKSKVVGISFKDRGAILPAGHSADGAYWYEPASGNFVTSTFYSGTLPQWVTAFNAKKRPDHFLKMGWNTLYPIQSYAQSTMDMQGFEGRPLGEDQAGFPYKLEHFAGSIYGALTYTPYGNTVTKEMAMAAVSAEQLGKDNITDFLAISFSTPDYIGHAFGPNSVEAEDNFLRLDKDLGELLDYLDANVGKNQYLVFLSADHGAAHVPRFLNDNKIPAGTINHSDFGHQLDSLLRKIYGPYDFIEADLNYQLFLNHQLIDSLKINRKELIANVTSLLMRFPEVERAFPYTDVMNEPLPAKLAALIANGYYPKRCGDIQYILKAGYFEGGSKGTTHGSPYAYDTHIPLLWYGWKITAGRTTREVNMTDVAPTIASLLRIQMPSGCVGKVIGELTGDSQYK